ncbi:hypothetical protein FHS15_000622 [Paenibacillus castaneae]|uniref:peptidase n=1 Tax=Paenibacillus castaneae TaxID=474957 RepID=UPI000C9BC0F1|nr:peptidase [Paenibacillus castaneae]NIK75522.1 hypothetical protein [Paenibacillus castaneae]
MKKIHKMLAATSILAMAAMPMAASAQDVPPPTSQNGQGLIMNQAKIVPATMGQITDFVNDKTGKFITVKGRGLAPIDQSEIILAITKDTKIYNAKGQRVPLKTIMDEKLVVKAFYGANITKSLPARGTALTLVVQDYSFTGIEGKVSEVKENGIVVTGTDIYNSNEETIVLHFADKTQIFDQNGKAIKASDIKAGMSLKSFYGPAVTMSIPPQSTTNYVIVNTSADENGHEDAPGTDGIIINAAENKITVVGQPMEKGGVNHVILTVTEDTQIVNQDGSPLTRDALKSDVRVDAYYGEVMTMIYPAQTSATKIIVKETETNKVEGTIMASDLVSEGQVYVNVGSDQSTTNDVILNITEVTKVISVVGGDSELKAGMKIIAYHSPIMTRSLPGITNASIVVVTSDDSTVIPN